MDHDETRHVFHVPKPGVNGFNHLTTNIVGELATLAAMQEANRFFDPAKNIGHGAWVTRTERTGPDPAGNEYIHYDWCADSEKTQKLRARLGEVLDGEQRPGYDPKDIAAELAYLVDTGALTHGVIGHIEMLAQPEVGMILTTNTEERFVVRVERYA